MIQKILTLYDEKSEWWAAPMFSRSAGEVIRTLENIINEPPQPNTPKHQVAMHPEDYTLFEIGEWDDIECTIIMYEARISITPCIHLKKSTGPTAALTKYEKQFGNKNTVVRKNNKNKP